MLDTIVNCRIEQIKRAPFQPRSHFSEEALAELSLSIQEIGLIHPPVVREIKANNELLYYELIAGERRVLAAKRAGLTTIQVIVKEICDENAAKASLIENLQRDDLDPIEVARAFKRLIETFSLTQEELSLKVGKKRSTVANYLRLLTLPEEIQQALSQKAFTMGHAKALLSLSRGELQKKLQMKITRENLTVRQAEREALLMTKGEGRGDCHLRALERELGERLGRKVELHSKKDHSGTVTIHFYGIEDFDQLLSSLFPSEYNYNDVDAVDLA